MQCDHEWAFSPTTPASVSHFICRKCASTCPVSPEALLLNQTRTIAILTDRIAVKDAALANLRKVVRVALTWKRLWDQTGFPGSGTTTYTTNCNADLYEAVKNYEHERVEVSLADP